MTSPADQTSPTDNTSKGHSNQGGASQFDMTQLDITAWHRDGVVHLPGVLDASQIAAVQAWTDDLATRPSGGELLQHYELTDLGPQIARTENIIDCHPAMAALITTGILPEIAAALAGEPVTIYKEKINYKLAGGAGFAPHQDARAYAFIDTHLSCMLAIDDAHPNNGCLEVVPGRHDALIDVDDDGCIHPDLAAAMVWQPISMQAGDLLWFHSRAPHRSGPNRSSQTRRALFCTYNAARLGDFRAAYYADKRRYFTQREADTARLSTIGDFQGVAPSDAELRQHGLLP